MDNLEELTLKIENLIESEKTHHPDNIKVLKPSNSKMILQILKNFKLEKTKEPVPKAEMIFLGAPTGAGKDTLVRKIMTDNPDKNYVVLNMDMFRPYYSRITGDEEQISDSEYAVKTNQVSYEIYYIIQELILKEFPGTNIIVTGTMRDLDWVKEIISRYKNDYKTRYSTSLATLAVPIKESAFSIFERYLRLVNTRGDSKAPLRYTDLDYHNDTVRKFSSNVLYFEQDLHSNKATSFFDSIKVYRRNKDISDLAEDTLIYDSKTSSPSESATSHIQNIMHSSEKIDDARLFEILDLIAKNSDYLKSQQLFKSILTDLKDISPQLGKHLEDYSK